MTAAGKDPMLELAARYADRVVAEFTARPLTADEAQAFAQMIQLGPTMHAAARVEETWYGPGPHAMIRMLWPALATALDELVRENALDTATPHGGVDTGGGPA